MGCREIRTLSHTASNILYFHVCEQIRQYMVPQTPHLILAFTRDLTQPHKVTSHDQILYAVLRISRPNIRPPISHSAKLIYRHIHKIYHTS